jgi:mRNA interferase MazF
MGFAGRGRRMGRFVVSVTDKDFISGSLPLDSFVRPNKIFTADKGLTLSVTGRLSDTKTNEVINAVIGILRLGPVGT